MVSKIINTVGIVPIDLQIDPEYENFFHKKYKVIASFTETESKISHNMKAEDRNSPKTIF